MSLTETGQNLAKVGPQATSAEQPAKRNHRHLRSVPVTTATPQQPDQSKSLYKYPMKGTYARKTVSDEYLNVFERNEVDEFDEVWFMAPSANKYLATKLERLVNNGFDDSEGYYRY